MRLTIFLLTIIILSPIGVAESQRIESQSPVRIGFAPEKLFDAEVGTPIFVRNESLWVFPPFPAFITLSNPNNDRVRSLPVGEHPVKIYTFDTRDALGTWQVNVRGAGKDLNFSLELAEQTIEPISHQERFSITDGLLTIDGSIFLNLPEIPTSTEVILVSQSGKESTDIFSNIMIDGVPINIQLSSKSEDGETRILIAPYAPALSEAAVVDVAFDDGDGPQEIGPISVWAELTSEIALSKRAGESLFLTYVDEEISETPRVTVTVSGEAHPIVTIDVPEIGYVNSPWLVPAKFGRATLSIFLEHDGTISVARLPVVIFPDQVIISPDAIVSTSPFEQPLQYTFNQPITGLVTYDIILAARVNGLDSIWKTTVTPSLATITVNNGFNGRTIRNYDINFTSANIQKAKVDGVTYVLLPETEVSTAIILSMNSIILDPNQFSPTTLDLKAFSRNIISTSEGTVNIEVMDAIGIQAPPGEIIIYRSDSTVETNPILVDWHGGSSSVRLPLGKYSAEAVVDGISGFSEFEVLSAETSVDITLPNLYTGEAMSTIITYGAILTLEGVLAVLVWRRALSKR